MIRCFVLLSGFLHLISADLDLTKLDKKVYEFDKTELKKLWYSAGMKGLLKAKGKMLSKELSFTDQVVFGQCSGDSETIGQLASCVVRLIDERDRWKKEEEERQRIAHKPMFTMPAMTMKKVGPPSHPSVTPFAPLLPPPRRPVSRKTFFHDIIFDGDDKATYYRRNTGKSAVDYRKKGFNPIRPQKASYAKFFKDRRVKRNLKKIQEEERISEAGKNTKSPRQKRNVKDYGYPDKRELEAKRYLEKVYEEVINKEKEMWKVKDAGLPNRHRRSVNSGAPPTKSFLPTGQHLHQMAAKFLNTLAGNDAQKPGNHIGNLKKLQDHFKRLEMCNSYFKAVNEDNSRLFKEMKVPINSGTPVMEVNEGAFDEVINMINAFLTGDVKNKGKYSILSPKMFSIMPESSKSKNRKGVLSPTIFSFHKDGILSMQDLFKMLSNEEDSQQMLLELIMDVSGAGNSLDEVLKKLGPEIKEMEEIQYPMVREMSRMDLAFLKAHNTFTNQQRQEYKDLGYTFYEKPQFERIYGANSKLIPPPERNLTEFNLLNRDEKENLLEEEIRKMAEVYREERMKRCMNGRCRREAEHEGVKWTTLHPSAYHYAVNEGLALEILTLSPHWFIAEILAPQALIVDTLSPRAFIASVLSPSALISHTLSPTALRAEVLSPRALTSWVLSPEALIVEVLSPRFLEPRVASPETLVIDILSPGFLAPHYLSSESLGVMVLSPTVLSPRVQSEEKLLVEILSPHILGGPHSEEEAEHEVLTDAEGHEGHENGHEHHDHHEHLKERLEKQFGVKIHL